MAVCPNNVPDAQEVSCTSIYAVKYAQADFYYKWGRNTFKLFYKYGLENWLIIRLF